jgi:hypothetical protein
MNEERAQHDSSLSIDEWGRQFVDDTKPVFLDARITRAYVDGWFTADVLEAMAWCTLTKVPK